MTLRLCKLLLMVGVGIASMGSCSNIDCALENTVASTYEFYGSESQTALTLGDTLTVTACGTDSVLYNLGCNIKSVSLPMSYTRATDTLLFSLTSAAAQAVDTVFISHTNEPYFESTDCGTAMFHTIKGITWTSTGTKNVMQIDSIVILNPKVNYETKSHLRIYFGYR